MLPSHHFEIGTDNDTITIGIFLSILLSISPASGRMAGDWIQDRVILEAKLLLLDGNHNVQQVADALNFTSQSFFGKYFKNATGMSPKAYKESM